ncbi:MAG: transketolase [Candidatus Thorarchaeota archaeon]|nr:transketolase [Candidatus Thorarchaeota archaeon]
MSGPDELQDRTINTIRFLSADAVQKANSGHPGMPMGAAAMAYALWTRHLRFNPRDPLWPDRDRFILSGGHGSMLLYALLYLTGYDITLDDIVNFRQWNSITPGHPEFGKTPGVEVTTGPLGQGLGNAVGMAIAEAHLAAVFNREGHRVVDHCTYAMVTDGDLMEGISSEAASLAGHLRLGKLILLYDDNRISIDGSTELTFTESVATRFAAFGWHTVTVPDGNDVDAVDAAITQAKNDPRPSLILCRTHIGYGLPTKQDTAACHGAPAGEEELKGAKQRLGWPTDRPFHVPEEVLKHMREVGKKGQELERRWRAMLDAYRRDYPDLARELERRLSATLPEGWQADIPVFPTDAKGLATRTASGKVINALAQRLTELIGGSADLTESNQTWIKTSRAFGRDSYDGRNIHFGVREHAMAAIVNGLAVHGGLRPYCATFLVFSDYMRPSIRLSALSGYPSIWIFTHDSIGLGEDGPTHQPIEHLSSLRAIPNLVVIRPADANEVAWSWRVAIERRDGPTLIALTRQNVPTLDRSLYNDAKGLVRGAYILRDFGNGEPSLILIASGSEVALVVKAAEQLYKEGVNTRVVSMPSWELFERQEEEYQDSVLLPQVTARLAVEAGVSQGWERWTGELGDIISIEKFGSSAPFNVLFEKYGYSVDSIVQRARVLLDRT